MRHKINIVSDQCILSSLNISASLILRLGGGGGGAGRRQAIYFSMGGWLVCVERFQIIWVIGVRPNQITCVVGISLHGRGRKNIICHKKREVLSNLAKRKH